MHACVSALLYLVLSSALTGRADERELGSLHCDDKLGVMVLLIVWAGTCRHLQTHVVHHIMVHLCVRYMALWHRLCCSLY